MKENKVIINIRYFLLTPGNMKEIIYQQLTQCLLSHCFFPGGRGADLEVELEILYSLGKCSTIWAIPPAITLDFFNKHF
jgi:hypothetical protein